MGDMRSEDEKLTFALEMGFNEVTKGKGANVDDEG